MRKLLSKMWVTIVLIFLQHTICFAQIKTLNGKIITEAAMDLFLQKKIDSLHIPSISIAFINHGKIVYQKAFGYADREQHLKSNTKTIYEAASTSKIVFGYFIMRMVDKGVISLDTPLYKYYPYPEIAYDERYKLITARMVLSHTTGLPNWHDFQPPPDSIHVPKKGAQYIMFKPGTQWNYSGEGYQYLVRVIAHLLHTDEVGLCKIADKDISRALNLKHARFGWGDYLRDHRATGYFWHEDSAKFQRGQLKKFEEFSAAGGFRTDAGDYAHFMIGMVNGKGLSSQAFNELLSNQSVVTDANTAKSAGAHWGLGVAIKETPYGIRYWHNGSNGDFTSEFEIYKDSQSGFAYFTNSNTGLDLYDQLDAYFTEGKQ